FGIHFAIHQPGWVSLTAAELVSLAEQAAATGVERIWVNDNFKARHTYSLLSAMAARIPCALGTLVTYPYARNPMDMATAFGTIAELSGKELAVGISTGAWAIQGRLVDQPSPARSVQEAMEISRRLLAGEEVRFDRYPQLASYFHIRGDATFRLRFRPRQPVSFWIPPKGPRMLRLAAEQCDGVLFNSYTQYAALPFVRDGTLERTIRDMERMRTASGNLTPLRRIFKIDISLDENGGAARSFAQNFVSFNAADDAERYRSLGLPADQLQALQDRYRGGAEIAEAAPLVGRELLDWVVLAGTPSDVSDRFAEYVDCADRLGFEQVILAVPLGPDPRKAVELAGELVGTVTRKPRVADPTVSS
ncbi:MAG: LLM class flavin-dependent oxidoreductase, partial [Terriglobia bacterium]